MAASAIGVTRRLHRSALVSRASCDPWCDHLDIPRQGPPRDSVRDPHM